MRKFLYLGVTILVTGALLAATVLALVPQTRKMADATSSEHEDLDLDALDNYAVRSDVYAADGSLLYTLHGPENRQPVSLDQVPHPVIDAILAVEDADFYQHNGVNWRATIRALVENVSSGGIEQGGSTITQQLVKNGLLGSQRDLQRKTKEAAYAIRLEQELSKDQILEKYLNTVYFGAGAYGVQAAAETYWGVDVGRLGPAEGAMLASLISNPVAYDPTLHPEVALKRRQIALSRMVELGYIDQGSADTYAHAPLPVRRCGKDETNRPVSCGDAAQPPPEDYFVEEVRQQLLADPRLGETEEERRNTVYGGGLKIYTTLSPQAQFAAQVAHDTVTPINDKGVTSAMVSLDSHTGAVRALVGGPGFGAYQYDIATHQPGRQTGSSFKFFVLLTALEQGNLPFDFIGGGGSFPNAGGTPNPYVIGGPGGTINSVTSASSNGAFVRMGQVVGLKNVADTARKLGVTSYLDPSVLTMPLGTFLTTPVQMASAYTVVPNDGVYEPAYYIEKVEDRNGNTIFEHQPSGEQQISSNSACLAADILKQNVLYGTATRAKLSKQDAAGKTGTTEKNYDAWFVGFTPYLTTAVWMGNPIGNVSMANLNGVANFGGTYPALIWKAYNEAVHANLPLVAFPSCAPPDRGPRNVLGRGNIFANGGFLAPKPVNPFVPPGGGTAAPIPPSTTIPAAPPAVPPEPPAPPGGGGDGLGGNPNQNGNR